MITHTGLSFHDKKYILGYLTIASEVYFVRSTRHFESKNIYFLLHKFQLFIHSLIRACACFDLETKKKLWLTLALDFCCQSGTRNNNVNK